jgi:3-oxoacyl-[acyl-carrier protein] reductase
MNDQGSMSGRVAVVTGAGGGIGSAICRCLAAAGASIVLTYRQSEAQTRAVLEGLAGQGHMMAQAPVEDSEGLKRLASQVAGRYGKVDLLVNNAGITRFVAHDDLEGLDDDLIDEIFRVNWRGAFACVRAFKDLLASGDGGLVVNISSIAGISGIGSNVAYCASKAALSTMTVSLARALAPAIRVVAIAPGLVEGRYAEKLDPAWRREQEAKAPLKRLVKPEDVANAVLALATQLTFSTGITIVVDGGRLLV